MPSTLQWANLVAFCVNIFFTYAGGIATLFGGKTNSQVSKEYTAIVTPAGWAFSIWSIIFIGEGIFTVWQLFPAQRESRVLKAIGYWWVIACGIQSAWTLAFAFEVMWLAALLLLSIAVSMGVIYVSLYRRGSDTADEEGAAGKYVDVEEQHRALSICDGTATDKSAASESLLGWWICVFPFSIHFGWLCAASLVNENIACISYGADTSAQYGVAITSLVVLPVGAAALAWMRADPVVGGVAAWAISAIGAELSKSDGKFQQGVDTYRNFNVTTLHHIATAAFVIAAIHGVATILLTFLAAWRQFCARPHADKQESAVLATVTPTGQHSKDSSVLTT